MLVGMVAAGELDMASLVAEFLAVMGAVMPAAAQ